MSRIDRGEHALSCNFVAGREPKARRVTPPGTKLEELIMKSMSALRPEGLDLERRKPHLTMSGHVTAGKLDFEGDYRGRAVKFDAKSCAGSLAMSDLRKRPHQIERVRKAHERGTVAFYLVEVRDDEPETKKRRAPRYFALTWPVLAPFLAPGAPRSSITLDVFAAQCVEVPRAGRLLDLVRAIRAVAELHPWAS